MIVFRYPDEEQLLQSRLSKRKRLYDRSLIASVNDIFAQVADSGDQAICQLTEEYDGTTMDGPIAKKDYIQECLNDVPKALLDAINHARRNIEEVNEYLLPERMHTTEIREGTWVGEKITPLESVGLWVPARKGSLISTALMLVGAAEVAGVKRIIVGMAPNRNGEADPATVAASILAGATDIVVGNGVGIIAGFSIGTESIPEVDGVFGPGPGGIAAAMCIAFSYGKKTVLGIGPTDSAIVCDDSADPELCAYDMLNESEHGPDSSSILVTTSIEIARETQRILPDLIEESPEERRDILQTVFSDDGLGAIVYCETLEDAIAVINDYAPEHVLIKCKQNSEAYVLKNVRNAGEILVGDYTPFTAGNYAIGIAAVLPTNGYAKNVSGITVRDMVKTSTIGRLTKDALRELLPTIREIGKSEGLPSHVIAAERRFSSEGSQ